MYKRFEKKIALGVSADVPQNARFDALRSPPFYIAPRPLHFGTRPYTYTYTYNYVQLLQTMKMNMTEAPSKYIRTYLQVPTSVLSATYVRTSKRIRQGTLGA